MYKKDCSAIILAAGNSGRMGQIKFALTMPDGKTFLENIVNQFTKFDCREIIVVVNKEGKKLLEGNKTGFEKNVKIVLNQHPEYGRFYSLKKGMEAIEESGLVFIHNADNPFVEIEVLQKLFDNKQEAEIIKPVFDKKGGHPVLLSQMIRNEIIKQNSNDFRLDYFLRNFSQKNVNVDSDKILVNINTLSDYRKL